MELDAGAEAMLDFIPDTKDISLFRVLHIVNASQIGTRFIVPR
jgi:hypothetical protein